MRLFAFFFITVRDGQIGQHGQHGGGEYIMPSWWNVTLKEDMSMAPDEHAQWANNLHAQNGGDPIFGLMAYRSGDHHYLLLTYDVTINTVRDHPDVLRVEDGLPESTPLENEYIIWLKKDAGLGASEHAAWANSIYVQSQADDPDPRFKGVPVPQILSNDRWGYSGSFSDETIATIGAHPDVDGVEPDMGSGRWAKGG